MEKGSHSISVWHDAGRLLCAAGLALALSACALSYVDKNGDTHYSGLLVQVVVPKSADQREVRAESVRVQSFGLTMLSGMQRTNFTLGYSDETLTLVRADSCVPAGKGPLSLGSAAAFNGNLAQGKESHEQ